MWVSHGRGRLLLQLQNFLVLQRLLISFLAKNAVAALEGWHSSMGIYAVADLEGGGFFRMA